MGGQRAKTKKPLPSSGRRTLERCQKDNLTTQPPKIYLVNIILIPTAYRRRTDGVFSTGTKAKLSIYLISTIHNSKHRNQQYNIPWCVVTTACSSLKQPFQIVRISAHQSPNYTKSCRAAALHTFIHRHNEKSTLRRILSWLWPGILSHLNMVRTDGCSGAHPSWTDVQSILNGLS